MDNEQDARESVDEQEEQVKDKASRRDFLRIGGMCNPSRCFDLGCQVGVRAKISDVMEGNVNSVTRGAHYRA